MIATREQQDARARECVKCPFYVKATKSCGTLAPKNLLKGKKAGDLVELEGYERRVRLCGCYLPAKWAARWTECPLPGKHKRWNKLVTKEDIDKVKKIISDKDRSKEWYEDFLNTYNRVFDKRKKPSSCGSCNSQMLRELEQLVEKYESE
jgi:hypothetical protein